MSVDGTGNVFVADWDKHHMVVLSASGEVLRAFGGAGQLRGGAAAPARRVSGRAQACRMCST
jgi:hypothetical protein